VTFAVIRDMNEEERCTPRRDRIPLSVMCAVLEVSRAGFYAWHGRARSERASDDEELTEMVRHIHEEHERRLGIDRLVVELAKRGRRHSPQRVRRLARAAGLSLGSSAPVPGDHRG
jgi:hypothetical protein